MGKTKAEIVDQQFVCKKDIRILFGKGSKKKNAKDTEIIFAKASEIDQAYFESVYGPDNDRPFKREVRLTSACYAAGQDLNLLRKQIKNG